MKEIGVGILGFGTVGAGVAEGLLRNRKLMAERLGVDIVLKRIADVDITTDRGVRVDPDVLTTDAQAVIAAPDVRIIVETIGGTGVARTFVLAQSQYQRYIFQLYQDNMCQQKPAVFRPRPLPASE